MPPRSLYLSGFNWVVQLPIMKYDKECKGRQEHKLEIMQNSSKSVTLYL